MALSANVNRVYELDNMNDLPIAANVKVYKGAALGLASGYVRPLVAGDTFVGFAERACDNTGGSAGAKNVSIETRDRVVLDVVGVTGVTNHFAAVYASDDGTFTLTSTSNTLIGKIIRWESGARCVVQYKSTPVA